MVLFCSVNVCSGLLHTQTSTTRFVEVGSKVTQSEELVIKNAPAVEEFPVKRSLGTGRYKKWRVSTNKKSAKNKIS